MPVGFSQGRCNWPGTAHCPPPGETNMEAEGREGGSGVRLSAQLRQQVSGASGRCWTLAGMLHSLSPPACIEQLPGLSREEGTPQTLTGRRSLLSKSGLWGWGAHRGQQASAWCWSVTLVLPLLKMFPDHPKKF